MKNILLLLLGLIFCQPGGLLKAAAPPVQASLISEVAAFVPGQAFTVGLRLRHQEGWHTYWRDPGSAGLPTSVQWSAPAGVKIGPLLWPQPLRIHDAAAGGLFTNIYTGTTILMAQVRTPAAFKGSLHLKARVDWIMCKDVCIPGKADLSLDLAASDMVLASPEAGDFTYFKALLGLPPKIEAPQQSFWLMLFYAFVGGLILNLMPCVLPVLSLKILSFVKQSGQSRGRSAILGAAFSMGVLVSFWLLALLVMAVRHAGSAVGWGFQFQNPVFVVVMAAVVMLFALNLLGVFEITLPGAATQELYAASHQAGLAGAFANGALATLLATPCSAPFLGSALGFAFSQSGGVLLLFFTAVGLGLALPYQLLSAFPQGLAWLPKPGAWMQVFKQFMGFLLLAAVLWLLWVLGSQTGLVGVQGTLALLLVLSLSAWLWGLLPYGSFWFKRLALLALSVVLLCSTYQLFLKGALAGNSSPQASASLGRWQPYSQEGLEKLKKEGRPIFVDFTAEWCWTCKVNEKAVLDTQAVQDKFKELNIALVRADWTRQDPQISQALASFGRSGVPAYVIYPKGGGEPQVLPELLKSSVLIDALDKAAR